MLAEKYKKRRYEEGKAQGKAEQDRQWRDWYERNKQKLENAALDPIPKKPD